jgi:hypothetical protein
MIGAVLAATATGYCELSCACSSSERLHRRDLKCVQAVLLANRYIVSEDKTIRAEVIASFLFLIAVDFVAKYEGASLLADEVANIIRFVRANAGRSISAGGTFGHL